MTINDATHQLSPHSQAGKTTGQAQGAQPDLAALALLHPKYLADGGGLFGAPPQLVCQYCKERDWELFYGHCRKCAKEKGIPLKVAPPEDFHEAFARGTTLVVTPAPKPQGWSERILESFKGLLKKPADEE